MKNVAIVGCGAYMDTGDGCPGEWRCFKAAAAGEGVFGEPVRVVAFVRCECPGRSLAPNLAMAVKLADADIRAIHLSTCLARAKPSCPYATPEEFAAILGSRTGLPVEIGTHEYQ